MLRSAADAPEFALRRTPWPTWIRREGSKPGFRYVAADGRLVRDARTLERIRLLAHSARRGATCTSPPSPRAAVQAWGFDAKGRKQYRYHARAVERGQLRKYYRVRRAREGPPRASPPHPPRTPALARRSKRAVAAAVVAAGQRELLPRRQRALRRGERDVRHHDAAQVARRDRRRQRHASRTSGKRSIRQRQVVVESRARAARRAAAATRRARGSSATATAHAGATSRRAT